MWIGGKVTALMWLYPWPLTKPHFHAWHSSHPSSPKLSWSGHAAASRCPAIWFSELSFPGTVWPWLRVNQALLGTTSWEFRVKREEVLLNMDWWSILRQNGVTSCVKAARHESEIGWQGSCLKSALKPLWSWQFDCTDSLWVNWSVANGISSLQLRLRRWLEPAFMGFGWFRVGPKFTEVSEKTAVRIVDSPEELRLHDLPLFPEKTANWCLFSPFQNRLLLNHRHPLQQSPQQKKVKI